MYRILPLGLALSAALFAAPALAKPTFDTNADGRVTLQEMQAARLAKVMRMDRDGDRRISRAEFDRRKAAASARRDRKAAAGMQTEAAAKPKRAKDAFARMDRNNDGFITAAEVDRLTQRRFARLDRAGTGYIAAEQLGGRRNR